MTSHHPDRVLAALTGDRYCPECQSDLTTGHGHSMICGVPMRRLAAAVMLGGWSDEEIAARKAAGLGGGAPAKETA